jgi:succinate dehydrogenase / fumarate reductase, cytochrome b subunit
MAQRERPLSPFLQYRWQYTNTTSILHRITGVLLSIGFLVLVYWLSAMAGGPEPYARAVACLGSPLGQVALCGTLLSFCYHLLNGIRHLFFDAGVGFERATARRSALAVWLASLVMAAIAWVALGHSLGGGA